MKELKINKNWTVKSDEMNLILDEYGDKVTKKKNDEGIIEEKISFGLKNTTYHANLSQVLDYILRRETYKSDFDSLKELADLYLELKQTFSKLSVVKSIK